MLLFVVHSVEYVNTNYCSLINIRSLTKYNAIKGKGLHILLNLSANTLSVIISSFIGIHIFMATTINVMINRKRLVHLQIDFGGIVYICSSISTIFR